MTPENAPQESTERRRRDYSNQGGDDRMGGGRRPGGRGGRGAPFAPRRQAKPIPKKERASFSVKLFDRWDSSISVKDPSLKEYINLDARIIPRTAGNARGRFHKSKTHVVERLALKLMVSGHTGKKHKLTSGRFGGGYITILREVEKALAIIEKKEQRNPLEVLVLAIENAALREEVISYQLGSIMAREAVITAPQRRVDKALRAFAQASYRSSFNKKKGLAVALADEIINAAKNSADSFAIKEKDRVEREATGAR